MDTEGMRNSNKSERSRARRTKNTLSLFSRGDWDCTTPNACSENNSNALLPGPVLHFPACRPAGVNNSMVNEPNGVYVRWWAFLW